MTIIPDDEDLETVRITRDPVEAQATASCAGKAACTIGFTIDAPFEGVGTVIATAHLIRIGGEFSDEAAVTVLYDDGFLLDGDDFVPVRALGGRGQRRQRHQRARTDRRLAPPGWAIRSATHTA